MLKLFIVFLLSEFGFSAQPTIQLLRSAPVLQGSKPLPENLEKAPFVVLDFWASWCGPCSQSFPFYEEQSKKWSTSGVIWIGVSEDQNIREANQFALRKKPSFYLIHDQDQKIAKSLGATTLPRLYIIKGQQDPSLTFRGFDIEDQAKYSKQLEQLFSAEKK